MSGKFRALTLIEEGELERLRQRQIKEYEPALKTLATTQENIQRLFDDPDLDDEGKFKVLTALQERFGYLYNKFKNSGKATAVPDHVTAPAVTPAPTAPAVATAGRAVAATTLAAVAPQASAAAAAAAAATGATMKRPDSAGEPDSEMGLSGLFSSGAANIPVTYDRKAKVFQDFLSEHKSEICQNSKQELVIDGLAIPNSSASELIRSLFVKNQHMNLIGQANLLQKLKQLNVDPSMFSQKEAVASLTHLTKHKNSPSSASQFTSKAESQSGWGKRKSHHASRTSSSSSLNNILPPPGKAPRLLHVFRF